MAAKSKERAAMGLAEQGWEEELFGHLGIDLKDLWRAGLAGCVTAGETLGHQFYAAAMC